MHIAFANAQIDLDYALDDGRLSEKANVLSVSVDDALRGELGFYYTREFKSMDLSFGISFQAFDVLQPNTPYLDLYRDLDILQFDQSLRFTFGYDQLLQSVENYGFSFRLHAQEFRYLQDQLRYQSISFASGLIYKPVFNNSFYVNAFVGLGGVLYENEMNATGLSTYLALECRLGYKFKL
jgi:hypothetical protein